MAKSKSPLIKLARYTSWGQYMRSGQWGNLIVPELLTVAIWVLALEFFLGALVPRTPSYVAFLIAIVLYKASLALIESMADAPLAYTMCKRWPLSARELLPARLAYLFSHISEFVLMGIVVWVFMHVSAPLICVIPYLIGVYALCELAAWWSAQSNDALYAASALTSVLVYLMVAKAWAAVAALGILTGAIWSCGLARTCLMAGPSAIDGLISSVVARIVPGRGEGHADQAVPASQNATIPAARASAATAPGAAESIFTSPSISKHLFHVKEFLRKEWVLLLKTRPDLLIAPIVSPALYAFADVKIGPELAFSLSFYLLMYVVEVLGVYGCEYFAVEEQNLIPVLALSSDYASLIRAKTVAFLIGSTVGLVLSTVLLGFLMKASVAACVHALGVSVLVMLGLSGVAVLCSIMLYSFGKKEAIIKGALNVFLLAAVWTYPFIEALRVPLVRAALYGGLGIVALLSIYFTLINPSALSNALAKRKTKILAHLLNVR